MSEGILSAEGATRHRQYKLVTQEVRTTIALSPGLQEHQLWDEVAAPMLKTLRENVRTICMHGFTEMVNNALEHSEGSELIMTIATTAAGVKMRVIDNGVGIFAKVRRAFDLEDDRHAILELSKGKLTTDSSRHSGEGIFFTSRMFDRFSIASGSLLFCHTSDGDDWLLDHADGISEIRHQGTGIEMSISTASPNTTRKIFDAFVSKSEPWGFHKTRIPVSLARYGDDQLISRSQAKRLLTRVDRFKDVVLDFKGVSMIGQGFADEVFRVFSVNHPDVHIHPIRANAEVKRMIAHVQDVT